jgi:hypothetical protein
MYVSPFPHGSKTGANGALVAAPSYGRLPHQFHPHAQEPPP